MPIHLNPFKLYKNTLSVNHGILVDVMRNTQNFWEAYTDLLALNDKRQSEEAELRKIMDKMGLDPTKKKIDARQVSKIVSRIYTKFDKSLRDLKAMVNDLSKVITDDEVMMYRAVIQLRGLYHKVYHTEMPLSFKESVLRSIRSLLNRMMEIQRRTWNVSKAHSRGFGKIEELSVISTRGERHRIRVQTLELDHITNRIRPLNYYVDILKHLKTHEEMQHAHQKISELLSDYHLEISDLEHILHETDVLIRRSEKLFKAIERETESLKMNNITRLVRSYRNEFNRLLIKIEDQARRMNNDVHPMVTRLPSPESVWKQAPKHTAQKAT